MFSSTTIWCVPEYLTPVTWPPNSRHSAFNMRLSGDIFTLNSIWSSNSRATGYRRYQSRMTTHRVQGTCGTSPVKLLWYSNPTLSVARPSDLGTALIQQVWIRAIRHLKRKIENSSGDVRHPEKLRAVEFEETITSILLSFEGLASFMKLAFNSFIFLTVRRSKGSLHSGNNSKNSSGDESGIGKRMS